MSVQVTMPLEELDKLRNQISDQDRQIYDLKAELFDAQEKQVPQDQRLLLDAFRASLEIVQFAVGNLHPSTIKGWPYGALRSFADLLEKVPGAAENEHRLAQEFRKTAEEAEGYEELRRRRKVPVMPAGPGDWGPQTEEARAVHESNRMREG